MNGSWAIFTYEVRARWTVLAAAAFAALIPLVAPLLPGFFSAVPADIRGPLAWGMALPLGWIMAVVLGATMIGSDLASGRASFLLSKPVSTGAIWLGKLGACVLVVVVSELVILLPAALLPGHEGYFDLSGEARWILPLLLIGMPLLLLLSSHALGIMIRTRSAWPALDAMAFLTAAFIAWVLYWSWLPAAAHVALVGLAALVAAFGIFLFLAGWAQVAWGRSDLRRGHRALSVVLWTGVLAVTGLLAGISAWMRSVPPTELTRISVVSAGGAGDWVAVIGTSGRCRWHEPAFLVNLETGHWRSIHYNRLFGRLDLALSTDGRHALWAAPAGRHELQLMMADLEPERATVRATGLLFTDWVELTLSDDGSRAATVSGDNLAVYDLVTGRLAAAVKLPSRPIVQRLLFTDRDHVRVAGYEQHGHAITGARLEEFEVTTHRLSTLLHLEGNHDWNDARWSPDLQRLLMATGADAGGRRWQLFDPRTAGEAVAMGRRNRSASIAFLTERRIAIGGLASDRATIAILNADGELLRRVDLGVCGGLRLGLEVIPGQLVVGLKRQQDEQHTMAGFSSYTLDLDSGELNPLEGAGVPVASSLAFAGEEHPAALVGRLFLNGSRTLLRRWDPRSGAVETVLKVTG